MREIELWESGQILALFGKTLTFGLDGVVHEVEIDDAQEIQTFFGWRVEEGLSVPRDVLSLRRHVAAPSRFVAF